MEKQTFIIKKCNFAAAPAYLFARSRPIGCKRGYKKGKDEVDQYFINLILAYWINLRRSGWAAGFQWKRRVSFAIDPECRVTFSHLGFCFIMRSLKPTNGGRGRSSEYKLNQDTIE